MRALAVLAAVNPLAIAMALWPRERRVPMAVAAAVAVVIAVVAAAVSGPVLDALDVTLGTFEVAAGVVLGLAGARWLIAGVPSVSGEGPPSGAGRVVLPLLIPVLVTPQLVTMSMAAAADSGVAPVAAGAAAGVALGWLAAVANKRHRAGWGAGVRLYAAFTMVLAFAVIVDGVKTV
jgi:small neutral amino acid transporter SnatA (MarC family)